MFAFLLIYVIFRKYFIWKIIELLSNIDHQLWNRFNIMKGAFFICSFHYIPVSPLKFPDPFAIFTLALPSFHLLAKPPTPIQLHAKAIPQSLGKSDFTLIFCLAANTFWRLLADL